jgi:hypothetical protein
MGQLPQIFSGDRTQANAFIREMKAYLRLNLAVTGFTSPIRKVALALTLIKGSEVDGWANDVGLWLDSFDPTTQDMPTICVMILDPQIFIFPQHLSRQPLHHPHPLSRLAHRHQHQFDPARRHAYQHHPMR